MRWRTELRDQFDRTLRRVDRANRRLANRDERRAPREAHLALVSAATIRRWIDSPPRGYGLNGEGSAYVAETHDRVARWTEQA